MTAVPLPPITRPILAHALHAADARRDRAMALYRDCTCPDPDCVHGRNLVRCEHAVMALGEFAQDWMVKS